MTNPSKVFDEVYQSGRWSPEPWNSGPGSDPEGDGKDYCLIMPAILKAMNAKRVVDIGCGDGRILTTIANQCPDILFKGVDCSSTIIWKNVATWPHGNIEWSACDSENPESIPYQYARETFPGFRVNFTVDAILAKDVLHHWPLDDISELLNWCYDKATPLITTNDCKGAIDGKDCKLGECRPLSDKTFPFNAYDPVVLSEYLHKQILLFRFE